MKKIIAALPLPGPFWTANTFVDGYPNVSEATRRHERSTYKRHVDTGQPGIVRPFQAAVEETVYPTP